MIDLKAMERLARSLGSELPSRKTIAFYGPLGAGKTTFIKWLSQGAAQIDPLLVTSPTFNFLNIYSGTKTIYHFDLYRMVSANDFTGLGFDEYFSIDGICCIEWAERIPDLLPPDTWKIKLDHLDEKSRIIEVTR